MPVPDDVRSEPNGQTGVRVEAGILLAGAYCQLATESLVTNPVSGSVSFIGAIQIAR